MHINILLFIHHSGVRFFSEEAHTLLSQSTYLLKNVNIQVSARTWRILDLFPFCRFSYKTLLSNI